MTAHFNLAILEDPKGPDTNPDAQTSADTTQDAEPSASAPDDQMYVKIPSRYTDNSATRRPHPTGTVAPTCRHNYGLVNAIPAGYESDDSWDNISHNHEQTHTHNIAPLLTLRPWRNSPHRGHVQQQPRQNNNTNVRTGQCTVLMTLGQSTVWKAHPQPTSSSCQSLLKNPTQVSNTIDLFTDVVLA